MQIPKERIPKTVDVQAIRRIEKERNGTIAEATALQVISQSDSDLANVYLRKLTAAVKVIKNRFVGLKRPATETLRQIRLLEADILAPLEGAKCDLSQRLMDWRATERQRIAEEQAKADQKQREREALEEKHAEEGRSVPGPEPVIEAPAPLEATDTTQVRKQTVYEVVDFSKVPAEFCFNDLTKIRRKMNTVENDDGTTSSSISVWPTDRPGIFLIVNGENIKNAAMEIPGINISKKEVPVYG